MSRILVNSPKPSPKFQLLARKASTDTEVWMKVANAPIHRYFERSLQKLFRAAELNNLFLEHWAQWRLSAVSFNDTLQLLPAHSKFSRIELPFPNRTQICYVWGDTSPLPRLFGARTASLLQPPDGTGTPSAGRLLTTITLAGSRPSPGGSGKRGYRGTFEYTSKVGGMPGKTITEQLWAGNNATLCRNLVSVTWSQRCKEFVQLCDGRRCQGRSQPGFYQ